MIRVVCALIEKENQVFVAQRGQYQGAHGQWEFPGGKIDPGETEEDALIREISEELCIEIAVHERLGEVVVKENRLILIGYVCSWVRGSLKLVEHQDSRWVAPSELLLQDLSTPDMPLVARYLALRGIES